MITLFSSLALILTLVLTALILKYLIPVLKSKKMGQKILDIGPRWHKSKEGTPTMGGLSFLIAFTAVVSVLLIITIITEKADNILFAVISMIFALLNGFIGIFDDSTKFSKGKNEGLLSWQKYLLQLAICVVYIFALQYFDFISTVVYIPFFKTSVDFGFLFYPFMIILITGIVNSVNLADGIDGLAASETAVVGAFFTAAAFVLGNTSLGIMSAATVGCCLGFLVYNFYPARVFMGDTGSLFLGGMAVALSIMSGRYLLIILVGIMYICESLSDIIQVTYFKLTHGKRIFKMAPIHHHFEKCGWSEIKIVSVFSAVTLIMCLISFVFDILQ